MVVGATAGILTGGADPAGTGAATTGGEVTAGVADMAGKAGPSRAFAVTIAILITTAAVIATVIGGLNSVPIGDDISTTTTATTITIGRLR